jgi:hypothetical protein
MKEIGVLMQRLTRENASLIKARWAFFKTADSSFALAHS